jgi:hypothetical protein
MYNVIQALDILEKTIRNGGTTVVLNSNNGVEYVEDNLNILAESKVSIRCSFDNNNYDFAIMRHIPNWWSVGFVNVYKGTSKLEACNELVNVLNDYRSSLKVNSNSIIALGTWWDKETDTIYIDFVHIIDSNTEGMEEVLKVAMLNNEKAIYNLTEKKVYYMPNFDVPEIKLEATKLMFNKLNKEGV